MNDYKSNRKKCNKIIDALKEKQKQYIDLVYQLEEEAEDGNIFAMSELATLYCNGDIFPQDDNQYLMYLKKIIDIGLDDMYEGAKIVADYYTLNYPVGNIYMMYPDVFEMGPIVAYATMNYCQYMFGLGTLDEKKEYLELVKKASIIFQVDGPGLDSLIRKWEQRIAVIEEKMSDSGDEDLVIEDVLGQYDEEVKKIFGEDVFDKLCKENRVDLSTALICLDYLSNVDQSIIANIDYSVVVMPLMKALENEIKIKIYKRYLQYLKKNISVAEYIAMNQISPRKKTKILMKKDKVWTYVEIEKETLFTMGNLVYILGSWDNKEHLNYVIDQTAIDFVVNDLINWDNYEKIYAKKLVDKENLAKDWIEDLLYNVEELRGIRNGAAHGGKILNNTMAEDSKTFLLVVPKILVNMLDLVND